MSDSTPGGPGNVVGILGPFQAGKVAWSGTAAADHISKLCWTAVGHASRYAEAAKLAVTVDGEAAGLALATVTEQYRLGVQATREALTAIDRQTLGAGEPEASTEDAVQIFTDLVNQVGRLAQVVEAAEGNEE